MTEHPVVLSNAIFQYVIQNLNCFDVSPLEIKTENYLLEKSKHSRLDHDADKHNDNDKSDKSDNDQNPDNHLMAAMRRAGGAETTALHLGYVIVFVLLIK